MMTTTTHSHIINRLHTLLSQAMMGDLTFRDPRIVDSDAVGLTIKAHAVLGLNEWDQPIEYPVVLLVVPELPDETEST